MGKRVAGPVDDNGVRAYLIASLADHVRETHDPRLALVPVEEWPDPMEPYVDPFADMYDALVAGKPVNVGSWQLSHIVEVPRGVHMVHVAADGTLSPTPYESSGMPG